MESKMLGQIIENTDSFIASVPKDKRKKYGQFFTNVTTAKFMASLFNFDLSKSDINVGNYIHSYSQYFIYTKQ